MKNMTTHEQQMIDWGCPDCAGDIELYDTNATGTGGRYRCKKCGRDTVWAIGKKVSILDVLTEMKNKIEANKQKE
jgi:predicted RNA-binding Zn-ribbon protein involved in translation (DUF1610 family)